MSTERRYRRLLRLLPSWYRERSEDGEPGRGGDLPDPGPFLGVRLMVQATSRETGWVRRGTDRELASG